MFKLGVIVALFLASSCCCGSKEDAAPPPPATPTKHEPTPAEHALSEVTAAQDVEREKLIVDSQKAGLFGEINYERGELVVGPAFMGSDFKVKQEIARQVATSIIRRTKKTNLRLDLVDQKSGKTVGALSGYTWRLEME